MPDYSPIFFSILGYLIGQVYTPYKINSFLYYRKKYIEEKEAVCILINELYIMAECELYEIRGKPYPIIKTPLDSREDQFMGESISIQVSRIHKNSYSTLRHMNRSIYKNDRDALLGFLEKSKEISSSYDEFLEEAARMEGFPDGTDFDLQSLAEYDYFLSSIMDSSRGVLEKLEKGKIHVGIS